MFLRSTNRKKDGKDHRYFSVVENRRLSSGKTAQRTVLYLGEINDQQEGAWRKSLDVFDEERQSSRSLSLFPEDRELPAAAVDSLQVKLSGLQLRRARPFGSCWLACDLWRQLGLDSFWQDRLPDGREAISWEKVLQLLVVNRLIDPGSELRVHRHWFWPAQWTSYWASISPWLKRTACTVASTGCLNISRACLCGFDRNGPICFRLTSRCCSMT